MTNDEGASVNDRAPSLAARVRHSSFGIRHSPLKVCDITQFWSPVSGGVRRYVSEKVRALRDCGGRHVLIIPGARDEVTGDDFARVYTIASPCISKVTQYRVLLRLDEIRRILAAERPDIVESGDPYQVGFAVARYARELGIPSVAFYHSHFAESEVRPLARWLGATAAELLVSLSERYSRRLYQRFARTLVASPKLARTLAGWGFSNLAQVDLGVDPSRFYPGDRAAARRALGIPDGSRVLLSVGRLAAEKNTRLLCDAFRLLVRSRAGAPPASVSPGAPPETPRYHLLITGEGLQRDAVESLRRDTDCVTWLPFIDNHADLLWLFHAADLFVHPGVQETFGLVTLEAQACGLPVVGIRGTAMDRIVRHTQDFWASHESAESLAAAIEAAFLYDLPALGESARKAVVAEFSWDSVMARQFAIYREVIAEHLR
jgi:alpha-1,6-mannosyltransferase